MKKPFKISFGFLSVLVVGTAAIFAYNATDEELLPQTREMIDNYPTQAGYSMENFRLDYKEWPKSFDFHSYNEYLKDPKKWDALVIENAKYLKPALAAIEVGKVESSPPDKFPSGRAIYRPTAHRSFLIVLSQKVKQGKKEEAFQLLEKSNKLLINIVETPQSIMNQLIALAMIKDNALFLKTVKDSGAKVPQSTKESFQFHKTPNEFLAASSYYEFRIVKVAVEAIQKEGAEAYNMFETNPNAFEKAVNVVFVKLFRPNQTLNWFAQAQKEIYSPTCFQKNIIECSPTYREVTEPVWYKWAMNPNGRGIIALMIPRSTNIESKMESGIAKIKETLDAI